MSPLGKKSASSFNIKISSEARFPVFDINILVAEDNPNNPAEMIPNTTRGISLNEKNIEFNHQRNG